MKYKGHLINKDFSINCFSGYIFNNLTEVKGFIDGFEKIQKDGERKTKSLKEKIDRLSKMLDNMISSGASHFDILKAKEELQKIQDAYYEKLHNLNCL